MSFPLYIPPIQLYLGGDPELFNQLETAPWRSVEYLRQILSLFGNEPPAENSEAQSLIRLFKIDTAELQEKWYELNREALDDPFGNERYVLAPEYKLLPPLEEITIPLGVDLNDEVITADKYYLLARALADTIIGVIFSKADFYFFKPTLDGITTEDDDYIIARNFIFFLLESQYFPRTCVQTTLMTPSPPPVIDDLLGSVNLLLGFEQIRPFVTEWYRLIENNRFFPRYFNLVGQSDAIAVGFPPEHIELIQQEMHNMNTYMGTLEYIENRRKTFENELSPEVIEILNPFIEEDETFMQITETLTEAREEASKRTGIPAYLLAMHQKRYFPSLHERPENDPMDEEYLFPYLRILLECPEPLRFEDGVQDERLRLCLFALEKAIQHSKDRDLPRLEFGVANFLNYSICSKLIRDQNILYVMKLIARHNSELFRYLVKIILDEVICDECGYPHGSTVAKAITKDEHIYYKIMEEMRKLTDLYKTDASFIYLPGANREGFGLLAETFLSLAQSRYIPNAIIYSFVYYLNDFISYLEKSEYADHEWIIQRAKSYRDQIGRCINWCEE